MHLFSFVRQFPWIKRFYLLLSSLQDGINVFIGDLTLLRGEHMSGTMSNDGQHLIFTQFAHIWIDQPACREAKILIMFKNQDFSKSDHFLNINN